MRYILTAQADALPLALREAGGPKVARYLMPGVALCEGVTPHKKPIFLRHLCPAEIEVPLEGTPFDMEGLQRGLSSSLLERLHAGTRFSVQSVIAEGYTPAYKRFDVNEALSSAIIAQTGAELSVKRPEWVLSVFLAQGTGWLGLSTPAENLSDWAGGMRRFKWEEGQISRAEFKLLEALEVFGVPLSDGMRALDLGAAPGGWTRVLRRRGLYVTAVDPADLDPRLARDTRVTHVKATAQAYLRSPAPCDLMVNDMKMDSAESAALTAQGAACLRPGGAVILTLKLPENTEKWFPLVARAGSILAKAYRVENIRQLFHNRNEATVCLTKL
ncbi:MAG: 50S rRNA methyltransferase [Firmicutes bacterium]|nr:50S rRNA methyltransferase [Bacillota bacterium]